MSNLIYKLDKTPADVSELLREHKNLVYFLLSEMRQLGNQDAESAAWEGLWDAICTFDVFCLTQFTSYACAVMKNAINDVLRKQGKGFEHEAVYISSVNEKEACAEDDYYSKEAINRVQQIFSAYIESKSGVTKNILLFWYSADFCVTASEIAKACKCSGSYVKRAQDSFRAYLSGRLKRQ